MKIINFGSCNIDYVYSLDHIVNVGETVTTYRLETFQGGKGLNQSIALARAGADVYHAGCIGNDGEMLRDIMLESGVDLTYIKNVDRKNGHAIIQVSAKGENSIFIYPGSNDMVSKDYIDRCLENFEKGDIVLLQNEISNIDYIIEKAYEKQMCIVLNPSPINERINKIDFKKLSYIILNEIEAKAISGCSANQECIDFFRNTYPNLKVVLTLGEKGSVYFDSENKIYQSAFAVNAVDTTGAGDTFTGYFVAGVQKGKKYSDILKTASAASAIAVSRMGAAPSIPKIDEVLKKIKAFKPNKLNHREELLLKKIENYVESNIKTAELEQLAKLLGYSSVYTGNLVKKLTKQSFTKYLQSKRCSIAAQKLLNTDLSVSEIIESIGYDNESFFRRIFKEQYGKNLLEYRKSEVE